MRVFHIKIWCSVSVALHIFISTALCELIDITLSSLFWCSLPHWHHLIYTENQCESPTIGCTTEYIFNLVFSFFSCTNNLVFIWLDTHACTFLTLKILRLYFAMLLQAKIHWQAQELSMGQIRSMMTFFNYLVEGQWWAYGEASTLFCWAKNADFEAWCGLSFSAGSNSLGIFELTDKYWVMTQNKDKHWVG